MAFCVWVLMVFSESLIRSMTQSTVAGELLGWSLLIDRLRDERAVKEGDPTAVSAPKDDHAVEKTGGAGSRCGFRRDGFSVRFSVGRGEVTKAKGRLRPP